jgi:hypothetical protein
MLLIEGLLGITLLALLTWMGKVYLLDGKVEGHPKGVHFTLPPQKD